MFMYEMPTRLYFGKKCMEEAKDVWSQIGKKALIVTGRHSAKVNGSQEAVTSSLEQCGVSWILFDEVENNPSIDTVRRAAALGKTEQSKIIRLLIRYGALQLLARLNKSILLLALVVDPLWMRQKSSPFSVRMS